MSYLQNPTESCRQTTTNAPCFLNRIPHELVLQITKSHHASKDLKAQALTCRRLFDITAPVYYKSEDYLIFRTAVSKGDLDAMNRCAAYGAAPVSFVVPKSTRPYGTLAPRTMISRLLESFASSRVPIH